MPVPIDPTAAVHAAVRAYVACYYPGLTPNCLKIQLSDGRKVELAISGCPTPEARPAHRLNEGDKTVLQAVAELGGAPGAEAVAEASGFPFDSTLKMRLSLLRTRGYLGGGKGDKGGYPLTEKGCDALAEES